MTSADQAYLALVQAAAKRLHESVHNGPCLNPAMCPVAPYVERAAHESANDLNIADMLSAAPESLAVLGARIDKLEQQAERTALRLDVVESARTKVLTRLLSDARVFVEYCAQSAVTAQFREAARVFLVRLDHKLHDGEMAEGTDCGVASVDDAG